MAKCGIERFDELPARVGFIDVDAARAALCRLLSMGEGLVKGRKRKIIRDLNTAYEIYHEDVADDGIIYDANKAPIDTPWYHCICCGLDFFSDETSECPLCGYSADKKGMLKDYKKDNSGREK